MKTKINTTRENIETPSTGGEIKQNSRQRSGLINSKIKSAATLVLIGFLISNITVSVNATPQLINLEGKLSDSSGNPLDENVNLTFGIYNVSSGGSSLWTETHTNVPVSGGLFDVLLGSQTLLDLPFDENYWLAIKVNDEWMTARAQIASAGYAYRAKYCEELSCPTGMVKVGSFCMDKYEASVWSKADCTGTQYGVSSDNYGWNDNGNDFAGYACSKPGVKPSSYITWFQAQQACGNAGKRLCTNAEWQMAGAGTPDDCTSCPCSESGLQNTGSHSSCVSRWGVYDMNGNLWEWVADWTQGAGETDISSSLYETAGANYGDDYQYAVRDANYQGSGQNFPAAFLRGGTWFNGGDSGVFALYLFLAPSYSNDIVGFRCCQ